MTGTLGEQGNEPKLNFTKKAQSEDDGDGNGTYRYGDVTITVTKEIDDVPDGFFKRVHRPSKTVNFNGTFNNGEKIGLGNSPITEVQTAAFYYWSKADDVPLLLEVTKSTRSGKEYYYKHGDNEVDKEGRKQSTTTWTYDPNPDTPLQERLDDRNCGVNKAIVFEIKRENTGSTASTSTCLSSIRTITNQTPASITEPLGWDYTVKEYNVGGNGTGISRVTYGGINVDGIDPPTKATSKIRVYYWKHNEIPLLIEFKKSDDSGSTWFANKKKESTEWTNITGESTNFYGTGIKPQPTKTLTDKLDEVNCNVNHVVQIDVQQTADYCHTHTHAEDPGHANKRISVSFVEDSADSLINYKAYAHIPNKEAYSDEEIKEESSTHKFNISAFKNDGTPISLPLSELPVMNAEKVIVFMCQSGDNIKTPLLIYIDAPTLNKQWFQSNNQGGWQEVDSGASLSPTSYPEILDILDKLTSQCKPPSIIIQLNKRDPTGVKCTYTGDSSSPPKNVEVKKDDNLANASGFTEYTHKVENWSCYFNVGNFQYNSHDIKGNLKGTDRVTQVSVYYWTALENGRQKNKRGRPLLVKVTSYNNTVHWYENTGDPGNTHWKEVTEPNNPGESLKKDNLLKNKLDLLNCRLNNAVIIDVNEKPGGEIDPVYYDRCNDIQDMDSGHDKRMRVEKDSKANLGTFSVYTHKLKNDPKQKFHIVGFHQGIPKNLSNTPILDVTSVKVYMCKDNPLLVYYAQNADGKISHNWLKKPDGTGEWTEVDRKGKPRTDRDTKKIWKIINGYSTPCQDYTMIYILSGVPATLGPPGIGYAAYWYFFLRDPWWRLM